MWGWPASVAKFVQRVLCIFQRGFSADTDNSTGANVDSLRLPFNNSSIVGSTRLWHRSVRLRCVISPHHFQHSAYSHGGSRY